MRITRAFGAPDPADAILESQTDPPHRILVMDKDTLLLRLDDRVMAAQTLCYLGEIDNRDEVPTRRA
jgi:hypothetical protein